MPQVIGAIIAGVSFAATGSTFAAGVAYGASTYTLLGTSISVSTIIGTIALAGPSISVAPLPSTRQS